MSQKLMIANGTKKRSGAQLTTIDDRGSKQARMANDGVGKGYARLAALEDFTNSLKKNKRDPKKKNDASTKREARAGDAEDRQKEARAAVVDSNRKKNTAAEKVVMEVKEAQKGDLDLGDLTFEQVEALKEFGGLTGNLTREQVDEIIGRVSPLTEGGRPFVVSTPIPTARFLPARRLKVNDVVTGRKILL
jgi:hypothetical protein